MVAGILKLTVHIGGMTSLKEKRRVVKSILNKIRVKFNVSAAETGRQDEWNLCEMGFSCVSNEASHADGMLSAIFRFIEFDGRVEIIDSHYEIIHF
ncbi:MAG: DUF503 domain-containing protein [Clostridiaceae bacterium]|nr:DUF503 domain-containing protein [Clostridiaceae bacterium]